MHIAAVLDDLECMKAIVNEANRDSNIINVVNRSGSNPFHIACVRGNLKMMDYLYTRGADLERPDDLGNTPLQLVLSSPSPFEAAKFLLERGASVNQIDNNKVTALHIAAEDSPPEVVQLLLKHKANGSYHALLFPGWR
jgi:ankyrin repeat protein